MCATSIDGIVQTGIFFLRNGGKVASGKDTGRVGAAAAQLGSLTDKVANTTSIFSDAAKSATGFIDKGILAAADKVGKTKAVEAFAQKSAETAGTNSIFGAVASKAINPLLIGAAGIRVLKDDDQYAALIEESSAMGLMFGAEKLMKTTKNSFLTLTTSSDGALKETIEHSDGIKKILAQTAQKFKAMSKNGQTATKIGLGILFVGAYSIGKTLGKKLSGRDEQASKT